MKNLAKTMTSPHHHQSSTCPSPSLRLGFAQSDSSILLTSSSANTPLGGFGRTIVTCLVALSLACLTSVPNAHAQEDGEDDMMMEDEMMMEDDMMMEEDMMGMDEMEMEMSMRGGGGRRSAGSDEIPQQKAFEEVLQTFFTSTDLSPLAASPDTFGDKIKAGPELERDAQLAYQSGNYLAAMQLHFAHMTTEYEQAHVALKTVKYSKLLKRPVWQIRWGVSYTIHGDDGAADPSPIIAGKTQPMSGGGGRGRGRQDGMDEMGMDEMDMEQDMSMEQDMQMEEEMGMDEMDMEMEMEMGMGGRSGRSAKAVTAAPVVVTRTMLSESAKSQMEKYLGLVAEVVQEEFSKRYRQGDFGPALCRVGVVDAEAAADPGRRGGAGGGGGGGGAGAMSSTSSPRTAVDDLLSQTPEVSPLWIPGMMFLGAGHAKDMVQTAKLEQIDLLLHFEISIKTNRNQETQNISRCRLLNLASNKPMAVSKAMDSSEVAQLVRSGRTNERTYVEEQLANLFLIIDNHVKATNMPSLTAEVARKRVGSLLSAGPKNRLQALSEVRLYQALELLTAEEVETAFEILGGQEGVGILYGSRDKKLAIARQWVLSALNAN